MVTNNSKTQTWLQIKRTITGESLVHGVTSPVKSSMDKTMLWYLEHRLACFKRPQNSVACMAWQHLRLPLLILKDTQVKQNSGKSESYSLSCSSFLGVLTWSAHPQMIRPHCHILGCRRRQDPEVNHIAQLVSHRPKHKCSHTDLQAIWKI